MRTEQEMMALIMEKAEQDDRIRAAILNGSRANPNVKKDIFQDYDIIYLVNEIESFTKDHSWVDVFGERIMMQMPEAKVLPPADGDGHFIYLMWFKDGNRIDLTLIPTEKKEDLLKPDSLSVLLLDKDRLMGELPPASDRDYLPKRPTEIEFKDICNEFWWISLNIAKGIWRDELSYTMVMYEQVNRNVLIRMLQWYIGMGNNYTKSAGKLGKYFKDFLEKDEWDAFVATYTDANEENIWQALFAMCDLFRATAVKVAQHFGYHYAEDDDQNVMAFLHKIKGLPKDATDII